jgi:hypothetical protein
MIINIPDVFEFSLPIMIQLVIGIALTSGFLGYVFGYYYGIRHRSPVKP